MSTPDAIAAHMPESHAYSDAKKPASRLIYWSIVREFWESPSIYAAPLAVAAVALLGYLVAAIFLPGHQPTRVMTRHHNPLSEVYEIVTVVVMMTVVFLQVLYSLDALYGERRERSILFWKSLPVSDGTTVLAKAFIPMIFLPLYGLLVTIVAQFGVLLIATVVVLFTGGSVAMLWGQSLMLTPDLLLGYHLLTVHTLWYAPIYCWILFVSAWSKRSPFVWVVFPPLAIYGVERLLFGTTLFADMLQSRFMGSSHATAGEGMTNMGMGTHPTPVAFLANPSLWLGLLVAAALLYGAARLRRYHEPI